LGWWPAVIISFFFSSRRRHTRFSRDWSSDVCSSDLHRNAAADLRPQSEAVPAQSGTAGEGSPRMSEVWTPPARVEEYRLERLLEIGRASCRERVVMMVVRR